MELVKQTLNIEPEGFQGSKGAWNLFKKDIDTYIIETGDGNVITSNEHPNSKPDMQLMQQSKEMARMLQILVCNYEKRTYVSQLEHADLENAKRILKNAGVKETI